jgi:hypothetical protein
MKTDNKNYTIECRGMKFKIVRSRYTPSLHTWYVDKEKEIGELNDSHILTLVKFGYWKKLKDETYPEFLDYKHLKISYPEWTKGMKKDAIGNWIYPKECISC